MRWVFDVVALPTARWGWWRVEMRGGRHGGDAWLVSAMVSEGEKGKGLLAQGMCLNVFAVKKFERLFSSSSESDVEPRGV